MPVEATGGVIFCFLLLRRSEDLLGVPPQETPLPSFG